MHFRRTLPIFLATSLTILLALTLFYNVSWRAIPQAVGLGEEYGDKQQAENGREGVIQGNQAAALSEETWTGQQESENIDPHAWTKGDSTAFKEPKVDSLTPYAIGVVKPAGSNYTKCVVIPKMTGEDIRWIDEQLGDMVESGLLTKAIYAMDEGDAPYLHPIQNKGNEGMAYLSYIIDFYDDLPDVAIFMHAHRYAWHNNLILDKDSALMVRHLSPQRVTRDGYMNLRCHWDPGCPDWVHPGAIDRNYWKQEEHIFATAWPEIFGNDPIPAILAQPCCAQFAVSRERIRAIPRERFIRLRDWILKTELSDFLTGRILEYTWQYIFTSSPIHCPSMSACYCDGYGLCFGDAKKFDYWFQLNFFLEKYRKELAAWNNKAEAIENAHGRTTNDFTGEEMLEVPVVGRNITLKAEIRRIEEAMREKRDAAFELGRDPRQRAKEAGRPWQEGDGF